MLPPELCGRLAVYSMEKAEAISNSFQKSIRGKLREEVQAALLACPSLYDACEAAFGTRSLVVENLKVVLEYNRQIARAKKQGVDLATLPPPPVNVVDRRVVSRTITEPSPDRDPIPNPDRP